MEGGAEARQGSQWQHSPNGRRMWWEDLVDDDPITLEPLANLPGPPFELFPKAEISVGTRRRFLFDGPVLAEYMISQGRFENPYNRESLTRDDCLRLDNHCKGQMSRGQREVSVTAAWDLQQSIKLESTTDTANQARAQTLRREASTALLHLFQYRRIGQRQRDQDSRRRRNRGRVQHEEMEAASAAVNVQGLTIIDDDEEATDLSANIKLRGNHGEDEFPELPTCMSALEDLRRGADLSAPDFLRLSESLAAAHEEKVRQEEELRRQRVSEREISRKRKDEARLRYRQECEQSIRQQEQEKAQLEAKLRTEQRHKDHQVLEEWETARAIQEVERAVAEREEAERKEKDLQDRIAARKAKEIEDEEKVKAEAEAAKVAAELKKEREKEKRKRQKERQKEKKRAETVEAERIREEEQKQADQKLARDRAALRCSMCSQGIVGQAFERLQYKYCSTKCVQNHRMEIDK